MFSISSEKFGNLESGEEVFKYTISNGTLQATFINYGATLVSFQGPDRQGKIEELILERKELDDVVHKSDFFGCTIGRNAFRIKHGEFDLEGKHYKLFCNNGNNHLHGGKGGFHTRMWKVEPYIHDNKVGLLFSRVSKDGEEGYPGNFTVFADYGLTINNEFEYEFYGLCDKKTIVNMTNHGYWNLSGDFKRNVDKHVLHMNSHYYYDGDDQIPDSTPIPVVNTPMDFTTPTPLYPSISVVDGAGRPGIDHAFAIEGFRENKDIYRIKTIDEIDKCKDKKILRYAATLYEGESGRCWKLFTTEPALIIYSSNWLEEQPPFAPHYSVCMEPGYVPNAINTPSFPSSTLEAGEPFYHHTIMKYSTI
ncbi:hypothetical protein WA158_003938 [Blastocystis sp. Blastoise]